LSEERAFARTFDSLQEIFEFTAVYFARHGVDPRIRNTVDFAVEELFTNMVKYGATAEPGSRVRIALAAVADGVEVTLTDIGVEPFDMTKAPDASVDLPVEQRRPGGLGIHLIRRLVDSWDYHYSPERRESRITFKKTLAGPPAPGNASSTGEA
jgi:serine/threonine-protein kinase RsbW